MSIKLQKNKYWYWAIRKLNICLSYKMNYNIDISNLDGLITPDEKSDKLVPPPEDNLRGVIKNRGRTKDFDKELQKAVRNQETKERIGKLSNNNSEELVTDIIKEKRFLIHKITQYQLYFEDKIKKLHIDITKLEDKKIGELQAIYDNIKVELGISQGSGKTILKPMLLGTCSTIESLGPLFGAQFQGLTACINKNTVVDECLMEMSIEYNMGNYVKPENRLALAILSTAYALHVHNTGKQQLPQTPQQTPQISNGLNDLKKKYDDL